MLNVKLPWSRPHRFLSDSRERFDEFLRAAREYVGKKPPAERAWLYRKPFDAEPGNETFYTQMYQVLNLLRAMRIRPRGRVLEVGSGPGWVSEILMLLGFGVDGLEPSEEMIAIAEERLARARDHFRLQHPPRVRFHAQTLEECTLPDESFDAVLFHESLHHVIDEHRGLEQTFRLLTPGGVLGVSEWAWTPGDRRLEEDLEEEMRRFGTLENPYTQEYLDELLRRVGFVDLQRYHAINGFFPARDGERTLGDLAEAKASVTNNLTARKPSLGGPTTADLDVRTAAWIEVLEVRREGLELRIRARVHNRGESRWQTLSSAGSGGVTMALRSGEPGSEDFQEAEGRNPLPAPLPPGESFDWDLVYSLPEGYQRSTWFLDLVNEGLFWFSMRGSGAVRVDLP